MDYLFTPKVYLTRWRIEEYYRFKKQQFKFEDLRVRSMNSIRNLVLLLTIALGYIGFISEKYEERAYVMQLSLFNEFGFGWGVKNGGNSNKSYYCKLKLIVV